MTNKIIAITGPTGAGKSTVANELASLIPKSANIEVGKVKHMIVNGYLYDESKDGTEQWKLLGDNIGSLAENFQVSGYNVIINGVLAVQAWRKLHKYLSITHKFMLLPQLEENIARDALRDESNRLGEQTVKNQRENFLRDPYFLDYVQIDSTGLTVDQTAQEILRRTDEINQ